MKVPKPRKVSSGNWYINLRLGGQSISVTESTERKCIHEAERIKAEWLATRTIEGRAVSKKSCTLKKALEDYIAVSTLSPSTVRGYKMIVAHRFAGIMDADIFGEIDWQKAVSDEAKLCSAKTLTNAWRLVSAAVYRTTGTRPAVRLPQIVKNERPYLTPEQISVFCEAVRGNVVEIPALLGLCSLRCSEILGVQWKDVDLKAGTVRVSGSKVRDENNQYVYKATNKNAASARVVPIMPQLAEALRNAPAHKPDDFITGVDGLCLHDRINTICRRHDLPEVGVHGLRHSFASLAYSLDVPYKIAMEIGGWSDAATMQRIYTHVSQNDVAARAAQMVDFYKNANQNANQK